MEKPFKKGKKKQPQDVENNPKTPIITDPFGCYTGRPLDINEKPVQDADDL